MRTPCTLLLLAVSLEFARADPLPANLVGDGLPPLDPQIVERLHDYTQFRSARFCDWHPVQREMLISTRFSETNQLHFLNAPGSSRHAAARINSRASGAMRLILQSFHIPVQPHGTRFRFC